MQMIWKFKLEAKRRHVLLMPVGAQILHVHEQNDAVCLWALVDPMVLEQDARVIECNNTGTEIIDLPGCERFYLGTAHLHGGNYVIHVFEIKSKQ